MFNFAGLRVMWNLGDQASAAFRSEVHKLWYEPVTSAPTRKQECIHLVKTEMTDILAYHYAERTHNASVKAEVEDIAKRIKNAFQGMFLNNSWIDSGKKDALLDKLNKTRIRVGYPDGLINASLMEQLYDYVPHISVNTTFVEIWHNVSEGRFRRELKKFRDPYSEHEIWYESVAVADAFYVPIDNKVEVPWGSLQSPLFDYGLPSSINFGATGATIGHEIAHAFDALGEYTQKYVYS
ncbi:hypothetical protein V5799_006068 [Amblyomma americanum]|uniref:M13 family peptidase n=1 Tax=Amblyomma americanum TaxID=6943 RepID=A0AAQ4DXG1_AMBAM